jgi:hypothetical protein
VAGKDVEDQLGSVENAAGKRRLEVAELRGRQVVIEEHQVGFDGGRYAGDFLDLAGANEGSRIGLGAPLHQFGRDHTTSACNQFAKLGERFLGVQPRKIPRGF